MYNFMNITVFNWNIHYLMRLILFTDIKTSGKCLDYILAEPSHLSEDTKWTESHSPSKGHRECSLEYWPDAREEVMRNEWWSMNTSLHTHRPGVSHTTGTVWRITANVYGNSKHSCCSSRCCPWRWSVPLRALCMQMYNCQASYSVMC